MERVSATYAPIVDVVAEPLLNMVPRVPGHLAHLLLTVGDSQRLCILTTRGRPGACLSAIANAVEMSQSSWRSCPLQMAAAAHLRDLTAAHWQAG